MPLETATFINQLDAANPLASDPIAAGDDHLRLIKSAVKATFPNITGAVTKTHTQLNNTLDKTGDTMTGPLTLSGNASSALQAVPLQQLQLIYPVGSIYMNATNNTNPATLFGFGTWVAFGAGRMPVGFNAADPLFDTPEETGGTKDANVVEHTHTFSATTNTVGDHNHNNDIFTRLLRPPYGGSLTGGDTPGSGFEQAVGGGDSADILPAGAHSHTVSGTTSATGSSGTNANLPPYITVYMWKRTA